MPNDTITLVLTGEVFIEDFATGVDAWLEILRAIRSDVPNADRVQWVVEDLASGSFIGTLRAVYKLPELQTPAEEVVRRFSQFGRDMRSRQLGGYSAPYIAAAQKMTSVIGERVKSVRIETDEDDTEIHLPITSSDSVETSSSMRELSEQLKVEQRDSIRPSYGSIRGRVQSITNRHSLRFTLYESNFDRPVSCYVLQGNEDQMRDSWGKTATIEGIIRRDPSTGYPTTVRDISKITVLPVTPVGSWRNAIGCAPARFGEISPEAAIWRVRDGE